MLKACYVEMSKVRNKKKKMRKRWHYIEELKKAG